MKRVLEDGDLLRVTEAVLKAGVRSPIFGKIAMSKYKPNEDEELYSKFILGTEYEKFIVDETYLLICNPSWYWFDPQRTFLEVLLILKINDGPGTFQSLCQEIDKVAEELKCDEIMAGTFWAADDEKLAKAYESCGYQRAEIQLIKKL